jgi:hypothetical protein
MQIEMRMMKIARMRTTKKRLTLTLMGMIYKRRMMRLIRILHRKLIIDFILSAN